MRPSCLNCARKHLAQADILMMEAAMGYPLHAWYAMGHMSEAADELIDDYPRYAEVVREQRKIYEDSVGAAETCGMPVAGTFKYLVSVNITKMIADLTRIASGEDELHVLDAELAESISKMAKGTATPEDVQRFVGHDDPSETKKFRTAGAPPEPEDIELPGGKKDIA